MKQMTDNSKEMGLQSLEEQQHKHLTAKYNRLVEEGYSQHPLPQKEAGKRGAIKKSKT
jgi:hypothetical protein